MDRAASPELDLFFSSPSSTPTNLHHQRHARNSSPEGARGCLCKDPARSGDTELDRPPRPWRPRRREASSLALAPRSKSLLPTRPLSDPAPLVLLANPRTNRPCPSRPYSAPPPQPPMASPAMTRARALRCAPARPPSWRRSTMMPILTSASSELVLRQRA